MTWDNERVDRTDLDDVFGRIGPVGSRNSGNFARFPHYIRQWRLAIEMPLTIAPTIPTNP